MRTLACVALNIVIAVVVGSLVCVTPALFLLGMLIGWIGG